MKSKKQPARGKPESKTKTVLQDLKRWADALQNKKFGWERTQDGVLITAYWRYPLREGEYHKKFYCLGDSPELPNELQQRDDWSFVEPLNDDQKKLVLFFTDGLWDMSFLTDFLRTNCNIVGPELLLDWRNICKRFVWLAEKLGIEPDNIQKYPDTTFSKWQRLKAKETGHELEQPRSDNTCNNAPDFRSVIWLGQTYTFNDTQAKIIKLFWESQPQPLNEKTIAPHINTTSGNYRLIDSFRSHGRYHKAWGKMIKSLGRGTYSLNRPKQKP